MEAEELDKWFSSGVYDRENKEINTIVRLGNIKNKEILVVGSYGALHISFKLLKYARSITVIGDNRNIMDYCKKKNSRISYKYCNYADTKLPKSHFDAIISPWSGLHYYKNKSNILKEFKRILKDDGVLLIEEADETSEYVKILNLISPCRKTRIKEKGNELKSSLKKFFDVTKRKLTTYYHFKNRNQCKNYFKKEIIFDEKRRFTQEMAKKIEDYFLKKKSLKIQEKSVFFLCKKKS